jgi:hypothetical protein
LFIPLSISHVVTCITRTYLRGSFATPEGRYRIIEQLNPIFIQHHKNMRILILVTSIPLIPRHCDCENNDLNSNNDVVSDNSLSLSHNAHSFVFNVSHGSLIPSPDSSQEGVYRAGRARPRTNASI